MRPEFTGRYLISLSAILACVFISMAMLSGPLKESGDDLDLSRGGFASVYLAVFGVVILYGAHLTARFLSDETWRKMDDYVRDVGWSILDAFAVLFLFLSLPIVAGFLISLPSGSSGSRDEITVENVVAVILSQLVVLLFAVQILRQKGSRFGEGMGLNLRPYRRLLLAGVIAYLAFQPLLVIYTAIIRAVFFQFSVPIRDHPVVDVFSKRGAADLKVVLTLSVGLSAPFFEEIFFRGFLYRALRTKMASWLVIGLSSVLFAAVHPEFYVAGRVFPLGVLLAYLMEKTGSVIPCIVVHFLTNGMTLLLLFLAEM